MLLFFAAVDEEEEGGAMGTSAILGGPGPLSESRSKASAFGCFLSSCSFTLQFFWPVDCQKIASGCYLESSGCMGTIGGKASRTN